MMFLAARIFRKVNNNRSSTASSSFSKTLKPNFDILIHPKVETKTAKFSQMLVLKNAEKCQIWVAVDV